MRPVIVVAGPTASGKSALALEIAVRLGGTVINADAMQCYRELRVVTARPSEADEAAAGHRLYGVRAAMDPANAAWWRGAALREMAKAKLPILCGGTGMYLAALLRGIAEIPAPGEAARAQARGLLAELGPAGLHARLMAVDPVTAAKLQPGDSQRVARAWEVWAGTGRGLAAWQSQPLAGLAGWRAFMVRLDPDRDWLRGVIERRFDGMLADGAVAEVRAFLALGLDPALPLMRAHGVPEIGAYLKGDIGLEEARRRAVLATHQYTKRQGTWFRHQKLVPEADMQILRPENGSSKQETESVVACFSNFIDSLG